MQVARERDDTEVAALRDGEYVGVHRFVLTLENGYDAKAITDLSVDRCGQLINLRTAIMRYRTPQGNSRFHRQSHTSPVLSQPALILPVPGALRNKD